MKNLIFLIALFLGLSTFAQETKEYTLNGQTFLVITENLDDCFGGKYKSGRIYYSQSGTWKILEVNSGCITCPIEITNISTTDNGLRLVVEYDVKSLDESSRAIFYFLEDEWRQIMPVTKRNQEILIHLPTGWRYAPRSITTEVRYHHIVRRIVHE